MKTRHYTPLAFAASLLSISAADAAPTIRTYTLTSSFTSGPFPTVMQSFTLEFDPTVSSIGGTVSAYSESTGAAAFNATPIFFNIQSFTNFAGIQFYREPNGGGLSSGTNDFSAALQVDFSGNVIRPVTGSALSYSTATTNTVFNSASSLAAGGPTSITAAVPEPATWAMMIGGFGMVGGVMRRRQRVTTRISYA